MLVMNLYYKEGVSNELLKKLVRIIKDVLEVEDDEIENVSRFNVIEVQSVNWTSHVDDEKCKMFAKYALMLDFVESLSLSLWYLSEGDFDLYITDKEHKIREELEEQTFDGEDERYVRGQFAEAFPQAIASP